MSDKYKSETIRSESSSDEINLSKLIGTLIDYKWFALSVISTIMLFGVLYSLLATPIYKSNVLIQVEQNAGSGLLNSLSEMLPSSSQVQTASEIELIQSRMILGKTIDDLKLDIGIKQKRFPIIGQGLARIMGDSDSVIDISKFDVPVDQLDQTFELVIIDDHTFEVETDNGIFKGRKGETIGKDGYSITVNDYEAPSGTVFKVTKYSLLTAINNLLDNFSVNDKGKDTGILELSYEGDNKEKINKILNSISNNYLLQNVARKSAEAEKSLEFVNEQLPIIRSNLDYSENKLNSFRQDNESVDLPLEAKSILDTMVAVDGQLNELTFKEAEISKLYTKEHPAYKALIEKRVVLENDKKSLEKKVSAMPKKQQEILKLTRDVESGQQVYMQMLNKQQELKINRASTVGNVRIIDTAMAQPKPVKPQKTLIILASLVLGCVLSIFVIIAKMMLHRGVSGPNELENLGISVYAMIPLSQWQQKKDMELLSLPRKRKLKNTNKYSLLAIDNPTDLVIEAIRGLRTSLHFAMMEASNNILMISGATPGVGKSFTSINLATVIAQSGVRVLIVDADLRRGYLHEHFPLTHKIGLSDVLGGLKSETEAIYKSPVNNLDIMFRGKTPPNPSELLMSKKFADLMSWANENYDFVIVDTPPILAVTDAAIIGRHAGTSLIVCRFEMNTVREIESSILRFDRSGVAIKGVIINSVIKRASNHYDYSAYGSYEYTSEKD